MLEGSCLCGAFRFEVRGEPGPIGMCHCRNCRKASGTAFKELTVEEIDLLKEHGVDRNLNYVGVDRKVASKEDADFYEARELEFQLKGFSSIPSINEYLKKKDSGKLNAPMQIMDRFIADLREQAKKDDVDIDKSSLASGQWLRQKQKDVKGKLFRLRADLASVKIAKVLTGDWFQGLKDDGKGNQLFESADFTMVVKASREKVYF